MTRSEGRIRLSEDDGPPATEFLEDDYDDDMESLNPDEALPTDHLGPGSAPGGDVTGNVGRRAQPT